MQTLQMPAMPDPARVTFIAKLPVTVGVRTAKANQCSSQALVGCGPRVCSYTNYWLCRCCGCWCCRHAPSLHGQAYSLLIRLLAEQEGYSINKLSRRSVLP